MISLTRKNLLGIANRGPWEADNLAVSALVDASGGVRYRDSVCHRFLNDSRGKVAMVENMEDGAYKIDWKYATPYIQAIMDLPLFKPCFIGSSAKVIQRSKRLLMRLDVLPANMTMWAITAWRAVKEYPDIPKLFHMFMEAGATAKEAILIANAFSQIYLKEYNKGLRKADNYYRGAHLIFHPSNMTPALIRNFLEDRVEFKSEGTITKGAPYLGVHKVFSKTLYYYDWDPVMDRLKDIFTPQEFLTVFREHIK